MSDTATIGLERKSIVEEFKGLLRVEMENAKVILAAAVSYLTHSDSNDDDEYDDAGALMQFSADVTKIGVVLDSSFATNVIHPKDLPRTATIVLNIGGRHFKGGWHGRTPHR